MSADFQITFRKNNGNLHVTPRGDFNDASAKELINLLIEQYEGAGRIFINTQNLCKVCPFGCSTFKCRFIQSRVPAGQLFFKDEKGFEMAPDGSKVIIRIEKHRCGCKGNCAKCLCFKNKKAD